MLDWFSINAEIGIFSPEVYPYRGIVRVVDRGSDCKERTPNVFVLELVFDFSAPGIHAYRLDLEVHTGIFLKENMFSLKANE